MLKKGRWAIVFFAVVVCVSLYLNWALSKPETITDMYDSDMVSDDYTMVDENGKILGESLLVNTHSADLIDTSNDVLKSDESNKNGEKPNALRTNGATNLTAVTEDDTIVTDAAGANYFNDARMNRKKSRDESIDILKSIANGADNSQQIKEKATSDILKIAGNITVEANIENIILGKGFAEVLATINLDTATILIRSNELTAKQVAQIKDIVISEGNILVDNIKIIPVK